MARVCAAGKALEGVTDKQINDSSSIVRLSELTSYTGRRPESRFV